MATIRPPSAWRLGAFIFTRHDRSGLASGGGATSDRSAVSWQSLQSPLPRPPVGGLPVHLLCSEQRDRLKRPVIRHRCHNRKCVNPEHLVIGSQADNKRDEEEYWSYEIDPTTSERGVGEARTEPSPEPPVAGHQPGHFRAGRRPRGVRAVIGSRIGRVWLGW